jgi:HEAT repeat protein
LTFLKDRASISGLEIYILRNSKVRTAKKAVSVLSGIPGEEALTSLARILNDNKADMEIRRAALQAISKDASSLGKQLVQEFRETKDPLASELRPPS